MSQLFLIAFVIYILSLNVAAIYLIYKRLISSIIAGLAIFFFILSVSSTVIVFFLFLTPFTDWFTGLGNLLIIIWFGLLNGCCYILFGTVKWIISMIRR